ncbi:MAG TPA: antibiotic biosynthesis monooxygenase [Nitrospira sp.]|nr:antibiotic biosynthesis monooxygenase [Nitrospira sp.]
MFARFLEMTIKSGKKPELIKAIKDEIIPTLKSYKGFSDVIHLEVETDPSKFFAISTWHDRMELEKYTKRDFPKIKAILDPFLAAPIVVRHCTVSEAISMKVATAVAA